MTKLKTLPLILLLAVSCGDDDLKTVAKALRDTSAAVAEVQNIVIEGNKNGLISDDTTADVLRVTIVVSQAGLDATAITRNLNRLESTDRTKLLSILRPVAATLSNSRAADGITDPKTRQNVQSVLAAIAASLNTAQLVLSGS